MPQLGLGGMDSNPDPVSLGGLAVYGMKIFYTEAKVIKTNDTGGKYYSKHY